MKLGHFPTPYPDELLYSVCARFSSRVAYSSDKSVLKELFGASTITAVVDLPNRLGHLSAVLPQGTSLTVDSLIDKHTLFPFFSAFLPPERVKLIRKDMRISNGPAAHMRSGVMGSSIPTPDFLRFCPAQRQQDKDEAGKVYWHRLHQLSGVEVCPVHRVFLENSSVGLRTDRDHLSFCSAELTTNMPVVRYMDRMNREHEILLRYALDATWLLEHPNQGISPETLHKRYLKLLIERKLATYSGSIHVKKLLQDFNDYYTPALLKRLHCELRGGNVEKSNWLLRLVRSSKHTAHPLYHLLLMQFFSCTPEEFFRLRVSPSFFGEGSWPCLNPVAEHYGESVIQECTLSPRLRDQRPVGTFSCECGFSYTRSGPDTLPEDRFRVGRIISFGQVWEAKLEGLWKDTSLSLSEVGRRLGVDPLTVRRHAERLGLPSSGPYRKSKPLDRAVRLKGTRASMTQAEKQRAIRASWLSTMRQSPKITLKAMRHKCPREYVWLLQHDPEWLKKHKPHIRRRARSTSGVDWKRRDAEVAIAVSAAANRLKNNHGRLVQVTRTAIGRAIGAVALLRRKLHNMPLTAQAIAKVVEARLEYTVRRIRWAAECFIRECYMPRHWQMVMRANVYNLRMAPEVKSAIAEALGLIESHLSLKHQLTA